MFGQCHAQDDYTSVASVFVPFLRPAFAAHDISGSGDSNLENTQIYPFVKTLPRSHNLLQLLHSRPYCWPSTSNLHGSLVKKTSSLFFTIQYLSGVPPRILQQTSLSQNLTFDYKEWFPTHWLKSPSIPSHISKFHEYCLYRTINLFVSMSRYRVISSTPYRGAPLLPKFNLDRPLGKEENMRQEAREATNFSLNPPEIKPKSRTLQNPAFAGIQALDFGNAFRNKFRTKLEKRN